MLVKISVLALCVILFFVLVVPVVRLGARLARGLVAVACIGLAVVMILAGLQHANWRSADVILAQTADSTPTATAASQSHPLAERELESSPTSQAAPEGNEATSNTPVPASAEDEQLEMLTSRVVIPPRPSWVSSKPGMIGEVFSMPVSSELHSRREDCRRSLDAELKTATEQYLTDYLKSNSANLLIEYDLDYIRQHLVAQEFEDTVQVSFGPMHQSHALLQFGPAFRRDLDARWDQIVAIGRLVTTGFGAGAVLVFLAVLFGYFRLDTATKGYYTGRLQFAVAVAILALIVTGVLFANSSTQWIRWLL